MSEPITVPGTDRVQELNLTIYESPFASDDFDTFVGNIAYLRLLVRDGALRYNESGFGSHMVWTQPGVLVDNDAFERALGIDCGLAFTALAREGVLNHVYGIDRGWSSGMKRSREVTEGKGLPIKTRSLTEELGETEFLRRHSEICRMIREEQQTWFRWAGFEKSPPSSGPGMALGSRIRRAFRHVVFGEGLR